MKKIILAGTAFLVCGNLFAQGTKEFNVDGLKVILRQSPKEVISASLFIRGGTANYPKEKEGIEALAFDVAITAGTKSMDKLTFNNEAEKIGTSFNSQTALDFGSFNMTCIKAYWDKSWNLFTDAILNPSFDEKEFNIEKDKAIANAKQAEANPDSYLRNLAMTETFKNLNYGKLPTGTSESLEKLTLDEVKKYYAATVGKKRCYLVVVGNITQEDLTARIKSSFSKMGYGSPAPASYKLLITKGGEIIIDRDIATNYLMGIMSSPSLAVDEGVYMDMAMDILYDRYFVELRTKRSLSYAPSARYNRNAVSNPYSYIYISTLDPKKSIGVMVEILDSVKRSGFTEKELKDKRQTYLTDYYLKMETSAAQAYSLGRAESAGWWKFDESFSNKVNAASLKQINAVFNKYTQAIRWTYLGKKEAVAKEDFKQTRHEQILESPY